MKETNKALKADKDKSKKEFDKYEVESAYRALSEAARIKKDTALMSKVREYAKDHKDFHDDLLSAGDEAPKSKSIKDLKERAQKLAKEED